VTPAAPPVPGARADVPIGPMTSYKLGGNAAWFVDVGDRTHLESVLQAIPGDMDLLLIGKGTNLLVSDRGFPGLVVRLSGRFLDVTVAADGTVTAGGAAPLPRVARAAADAARCGLEFLAGIPGTVGGGVAMNAGGHGSEISDRLVGADVVDRRTGKTVERGPADLDLSYRHSNLGPGDVVVAARFTTDPCERADADRRIREITRWRKEHQPGGTFNAGSVFKNPPGDAAGRLIDEAGLKGLRVGGVAVSEMHANFFTADEDATAGDVWDLIREVRRRVGERTGIWLTPEIRLAGPFEGRDLDDEPEQRT